MKIIKKLSIGIFALSILVSCGKETKKETEDISEKTRLG